MIYRGPDFLAHPLPPLSHIGGLRKRDNLLKGEGGEGVVEEPKSYGHKAWSSVNHSILVGMYAAQRSTVAATGTENLQRYSSS
jgi:hypothetical protein